MVADAERLTGSRPDIFIDVSKVSKLDTFGAWLIERLRRSLAHGGVEARIAGLSANYSSLVDEVRRLKATAVVDTTSMKMLGRLPVSFSASATICSSSGAKRAVHEPAARSASPLPCAIRSNVGSPFTMPTPVPILRYSRRYPTRTIALWNASLTSHNWVRRATLRFRNCQILK